MKLSIPFGISLILLGFVYIYGIIFDVHVPIWSLLLGIFIIFFGLSIISSNHTQSREIYCEELEFEGYEKNQEKF